MRNASVVIAAIIITGLVAVAGLITSVVVSVNDGHAIASDLEQSNYNTCLFIRGIIFSFHTPQGQASAKAIITRNPALGNCKRYAQTLNTTTTRTQLHKPG